MGYTLDRKRDARYTSALISNFKNIELRDSHNLSLVHEYFTTEKRRHGRYKLNKASAGELSGLPHLGQDSVMAPSYIAGPSESEIEALFKSGVVQT